MTIIAGYALNRRNAALLDLAAVLARSTGQDLVVGVVSTAPWAIGGERGESYINEVAEEALDQARAALPGDINASFVSHRARSVPEGLLELARQHQATALVVGSSLSGAVGSVTPSSVASRLLYSAEVPILQPPRGYRAPGGTVIRRLTISYSGAERAGLVVERGMQLAASMGASVRLASFFVQIPPPSTALFHAESRDIMKGWEASLREAADRLLDRLDTSGLPGGRPELVLGRGRTWAEAMDDIGWEHESDLLLIGSSRAGMIARVFIGMNGTKIAGHSPVPAMVLPRLDAD